MNVIGNNAISSALCETNFRVRRNSFTRLRVDRRICLRTTGDDSLEPSSN